MALLPPAAACGQANYDPQSVAQVLLDAMQNSDYSTISAHTSPVATNPDGYVLKAIKPNTPLSDPHVADIHKVSDTASDVTVTYTVGSEPTTIVWHMTKHQSGRLCAQGYQTQHAVERPACGGHPQGFRHGERCDGHLHSGFGTHHDRLAYDQARRIKPNTPLSDPHVADIHKVSDTASDVTVTYTVGSEPTTIVWHMTKHDGVWRVPMEQVLPAVGFVDSDTASDVTVTYTVGSEPTTIVWHMTKHNGVWRVPMEQVLPAVGFVDERQDSCRYRLKGTVSDFTDTMLLVTPGFYTVTTYNGCNGS